MHLRRLTLPAILLLPALAAPAARAADAPRTDEQTLRAAGLPTDDAGLIEFFRSRTQPKAGAGRVAGLVRDLGDPSAERRDRASGELVALGPVALPLLRQAVKDPDDVPRASCAKRCLRLLEGDQAALLPAAAARLLAHRRPPGAAEALLAYLPYADDETVTGEIQAALALLAVRDGRPDPDLIHALDDPSALRRATAAEVLGRAAGPDIRPHLRRLLQDPRPGVRLRVALTLARDAHDPEALPTLIALLADGPLAEARRAEDYLQTLAGEQAPNVHLKNDTSSRRRCRNAWAAWWRGADGTKTLDELRKRIVMPETRAKAQRLVRQLGDESFAAREKAMADLQALGPAVAPFLQQFTNDADGEVRARIHKLLKNAKGVGPLTPVVFRILALRKPAGTVAAVLDVVPGLDDEALTAEAQEALAALAGRDGRADPALVEALDDPLPLRRGLAAAALWQGGPASERPALRRLLHDGDPGVRLRVARAAAAVRERAAVPVLIDLLPDVPLGPASEVDEYLQRVAGERGPDLRPGADAASRRKCRDAWVAWWKANGAGADLPGPEPEPVLLGYTLVLYQNPLRVVEYGPDQKQRWDITGIGYSYDVQALPGNRVLLAEWGSNRVTERNVRGEVLWEKQAQQPVNCQRLPNGHTVIGHRSGLTEVDRAGNEVFAVHRPQGDLSAARRARDGSVWWVTQEGQCEHLDATGKVIKSFGVGTVGMGGLELLPGGHVLVAQNNDFRVVEYDADGRSVWSAAVQMPTSAVRLPNGHTLVTSQFGQQVLELDRAGKTVWELKAGGQQPCAARRR